MFYNTYPSNIKQIMKNKKTGYRQIETPLFIKELQHFVQVLPQKTKNYHFRDYE
jgi:hypothetical protein